jgi:hypothetical protein
MATHMKYIKFKIIQVEVNGWWEWPPATITREIAVKNRSHNPKTSATKLQSFLSIWLAAFQAGGGAEPVTFEP